MLDEKLQEFWDAKKFATSWIISSNNLEESLEANQKFCSKSF
jgi:hypothetical protein